MTEHVTVSVEPIPDCDVLRMTWQHKVNALDVTRAFAAIMEVLNHTDHPTYIVVDIRSNPSFPLIETAISAVDTQRHPMLAQWLVVGTNWMAHTIERVLVNMSGETKVVWFATEAEAQAYLEADCGCFFDGPALRTA